MATPYTSARARATLLRAHSLLHPDAMEIAALTASGISANRVLALYPFDFTEYVPALSSAFTNPGLVKVALRLEMLHKIALQNFQSASRFAQPEAGQAWNALREAKALNPVLNVISPFVLGERRSSKQVDLRGSAYMMLMNMHALLWGMGAWQDVQLPIDSLDGAEQHLLGNVLRSMEGNYINPLLTDISAALTVKK